LPEDLERRVGLQDRLTELDAARSKRPRGRSYMSISAILLEVVRSWLLGSFLKSPEDDPSLLALSTSRRFCRKPHPGTSICEQGHVKRYVLGSHSLPPGYQSLYGDGDCETSYSNGHPSEGYREGNGNHGHGHGYDRQISYKGYHSGGKL
jgi:hypothetical protein